ncbi:YihY/virulence factor BrkB family protein [Stieleria sp. TO1_6]|uniref:YihY/virulence factor BrkB family protein n=1 Tax=Stieleria tagensis TaxID=2956795 RepID=UPI00209BA691|nr:YihY/virulence factor BrkB family protein [Stieleria tagensis]MCO8124898.1 YihY/virulence factor BrkB family protein [Stieleria tagensis]
MKLLKNVVSRFTSDDCSTMAAALAYYTIFALPPLLYLLLTIVTYTMVLAYDMDQAGDKARELISTQAGDIIGNEKVAEEITKILQRNHEQGGAWWKSIISLVGILFGATGVVAAVQSSLNRVWEVQPDPDAGSVKQFIVKRFLSLTMILGLGFLLLVSMVVSTALAIVGASVGNWLGIEQTIVAAINYGVTFLVTLVVFAALFKFMPDAKIAWKDVWMGAFVTAVLFSIGRYAMGLYFANMNIGAQLGSAAASLVVLLVWIYYTSMIFLFGAEFTQAWSHKRGRGIEPEEGAVRVEQTIVRS